MKKKKPVRIKNLRRRNPSRLKEKKLNIKELNKPVRINKFIADAGICSRRKADDLVKEGRVKVNGKKVMELSERVSQADHVTVNGDPVGLPEKHIYILLNKPKDTITTTDDEKDRGTVVDIVRKKERIYPVGRLDRNTTGALLMTNDGELANRLMHPRYKTEKVYDAKLDEKRTREDSPERCDCL